MEELASIEDVDLATLELELDEVCRSAELKAAPKARARKRKSARELARDAARASDAHPVVEHLALAYEGKQFLPELWRVKQFLESHGVMASRIRSRADALPKVVGVLARLSQDDLARLVVELRSEGNDLSVLTDQILGPPPAPTDGQGKRAMPRR